MQILVTGGLGFIGSHLSQRLLRDGHEVWCVDDCSGPQAADHALLFSNQPAWRFRNRDITTISGLSCAPDVLIHLAAKAGVRASLTDPRGYVRTNVEGTTNVLECAREAGVSSLIFASSSSVYGHPVSPGRPSRETDRVQPLSPYGATKVAAEVLCQTYANLYGMDIMALRFFSVYGPRQRPDLALPIFTRQMLAGKPLEVFGDGSALRDYTYIDDLVDGICLAVQRVTDAPQPIGYRCVNLGSGSPVPLYTVIDTLQAALGVPDVQVHYGDPHPADVASTHADLLQARVLLGYTPRISFAEGIQRYADWLWDTTP